MERGAEMWGPGPQSWEEQWVLQRDTQEKAQELPGHKDHTGMMLSASAGFQEGEWWVGGQGAEGGTTQHP